MEKLTPLEQLNLETGNLAENWQQQFEVFLLLVDRVKKCKGPISYLDTHGQPETLQSIYYVTHL